MAVPVAGPSAWRGWCYLVWFSWQRLGRARLLVLIALGLLAFTIFLVALLTAGERWSMGYRRFPNRSGPSYQEVLERLEWLTVASSLAPATGAGPWAATGSFRAVLDNASGLFVFSNVVVFALFTTFLLPLLSLSFATEGLGREREGQTLTWLLSRPLPRASIFLGKFLALLPWCLALNLGGFAGLCLAGGAPGRLAWQIYWPAVLLGTLTFAALFHLFAACLRRAAVLALLYAFFFETVLGNMPGNLKRLSISYYTRCLMFELAHRWDLHPEKPQQFLPVSGSTAFWTLLGATGALLLAGMIVFCRREYLDGSG